MFFIILHAKTESPVHVERLKYILSGQYEPVSMHPLHFSVMLFSDGSSRDMDFATQLNYWEKLKLLRMNSEQKIILYVLLNRTVTIAKCCLYASFMLEELLVLQLLAKSV